MSVYENIRKEYVEGENSYRELAVKFSVPYGTLARIAGEEDWVGQRNLYRKEKSDISARLDTVSERLIDKLERAIDELDNHITTVRIKEKTVEYDDEGKKVISEKVVDKEEVKVEKGIIDRGALKQLVSTLKELRGKEADSENDDESVTMLLSEEAMELAK